MFFFTDQVPDNIRLFLIPFLAPWIDRADLPLFGIETLQYGLITFRRYPWPGEEAQPTWVTPAGEVDVAALAAYSASIGA